MWSSFVPDLVVALIGAAIGALLTVAIAAGTFLLSRRYRETQALTLLIEELHHRRALAPIDTLMVVANAEQSDDFARVAGSVLSIKDAIREARAASRPTRNVRVPLSKMTSACNRYLELADRQPHRYWYFLADLRRDIETATTELAQANRKLPSLEPGAARL